MPGRDPLDLMNEVENVLQIHSYAMNWPIGTGKEFQGVVDRSAQRMRLLHEDIAWRRAKSRHRPLSLEERESKEKSAAHAVCAIARRVGSFGNRGQSFSQEDFFAGKVTPVFFASALTNFGVEPFFDAFIHLAPCPHGRMANRVRWHRNRDRSRSKPPLAAMFSNSRPTWTGATATAWPLSGFAPAGLKGT